MGSVGSIPKLYQCVHRHVSGRRCKRLVRTRATRCESCKVVGPRQLRLRADVYCVECISMLHAFGLRAEQ